jgi:type IX secretion system PorP/SprF family membrane protein
MKPIILLVKKYFFAGLLLFLPFLNSQAQDVHFSQFNMAPLQQNPAMAGALYDLQAIVLYREQWRSVIEPFTTISASLDMRLHKKRVKTGFWAAGLNFFSDRAGSARLGSTQGSISIAYQLKLNKYHLLGVGMQGSFAQWGFSPDGLQWGKQYQGGAFNPTLPTGELFQNQRVNYFDAGTGINWTYNNTAGARMVTDNHDLRFSAGFAIFHPIRPDYSVIEGNADKLYVKTVLYGNGLISIANTDLAFVPGFFVYNQGPSRQIFAGSLLRYKFKQESKYTGFERGAAVSAGMYLRAQDGFAACMLLELAKIAVGVSYDFNTSAFRNATGTRGAFELSLRFINPNPFMTSASRSRI